MRIKSVKDFVEMYSLEAYINNCIKTWKSNTFGKCVEKFVVESAKVAGYKITKTTPEYDYIYGADFKVLFDGGESCYCDLKITYKIDRLKDVEVFLGETLEFDANYDTREVVSVGKSTFMSLGVRYVRTLRQGKIVYDKPVLVPIIWGDIKKESILCEEVAKNIKLLLAFGVHRLKEQGYDKAAKRSFTFIPNEAYETK